MERDLAGVLAAVADVIAPVVPFEAIGIVSFEGTRHDLMPCTSWVRRRNRWPKSHAQSMAGEAYGWSGKATG